MSLAAETRAAARERPFLVTALRARVVNFTAAADWLIEEATLDGDTEAVATALSRFADDLPDHDKEGRRASVAMRSGVDIVDTAEIVDDGETDHADNHPDTDREGDTDTDHDDVNELLCVGDTAVVPDGNRTAIVATGDVDAGVLSHALAVVAIDGITIHAAGVGRSTLVVVVRRRDGANAVRKVEAALADAPQI